ncbi:MAG: hypothetical protein R2705_08130 [Ilumatobacteraceae bacterium]
MTGVSMHRQTGAGDDGVVVETMQASELAGAIAQAARRTGVRLLEVRPLDDSLEPVPGARAMKRFVVIVRYTLTSCLPFRRWLALLWPCLGTLLFGALTHAVDSSPARAFSHIAVQAVFGLTLPVAALIIGDAVMGAEIRSGHVPFHLAHAGPELADRRGSLARRFRRRGGDHRPAAALAAVIAGVPKAVPAVYVAALVGGVAYVALFSMIGCITRRTAVWSLAVVFLIERLLGAALTGIAQLSPTWESQEIFLGYYDDAPSSLVRDGIPHGSGAVVRLALVSAGCLLIAWWRLSRLTLSGASD